MLVLDFNKLKQTVSELSPRQKSELEKHLLNPESKPEVLKLLEKTLSGCLIASIMTPINGVHLKGVSGLIVSHAQNRLTTEWVT